MNNPMNGRGEGQQLSVNETPSQKNIQVYYGEQFDDGDDPEIDFSGLWRIIRRYQRLISIVFAVVMVSALAITLLLRPMYSASSYLELNTSLNVVKFNQLNSDNLKHGRYRQTQITFLSSRAIATEVVRRLNLTEEPEFNGSIVQRSPASLLRSLLKIFSSGSDGGGANMRLAENIYLSRLSVAPVSNSDILKITVQGFDPLLAAKIANEHANAYVSLTSNRRLGSSSEAKKFIERELSEVKDRLRSSENSLTVFARENNDVDIEDADNIILSRLAALNESVSEVQSARIDAETKYIQAQNGGINLLSSVYSNPLIADLRAQKMGLEAEYLELSKLYKPKYPSMLELKAKIDEVGSGINEQSRNVVATLKSNYLQLSARESELRNALQTVKNELFDLRDRAVEYNILKREWEADKGLYSELLKRSKELEVSAGIELNAGALVEDAVAPANASSPNLKFNLFVAAIIGLGGGIGLALFLGLLDNRINDVRLLENVTQTPNLAVLPKIGLQCDAPGEGQAPVPQTPPELQALHAPGDIFCESIDSLRTSLKYIDLNEYQSDQAKVFAVTSAISGEGKSLIATNLAASYAKSGKKTLLIEVDLRRPRLAKVFDAAGLSGLVEALNTGEPVRMKKLAEQPNLSLIFAGSISTNPVKELGSDTMAKLIAKSKADFDIVILDCPPVMGLADTIEVSSLVDGMLLIVSAHNVRKHEVEHAMARLRMVDAPVLGTVFNRASPEISGYNYYTYGYYTDNANQKTA
jgi:capsular exopolysaccharide synthesis family protein